jgi:predicted MFS family arabinose efflux permease
MPIRNIVILLTCQLISATGAIVIVTLGGIIGSKLVANPAFATLPVSIMVVVVAATTIPATILMRKIGRRYAFSLSSLCAVTSVLIAAFALYSESFAWFILATGAFGINMAFTQQYRYAAAESVEPRFVPRAISLVLVGAIGGAFLGPELVKYGEYAIPTIQYAGTLLSLSLLFLVQSALFLTLGPLRGEDSETAVQTQRPLGSVTRQPVFIVAVLGGTVAYGVMTFIMTATPLSMHIKDGFSLADTSQIIRSHVIAMYAPSLISGYLMERLGVIRMMTIGGFGLVLACVIGLQGQSMMHYWYTLVLLGVGWNFLYVGGTTMLTLTYSMSERFKAQAVNEFSVFGTSALGSLLAGTVMYVYGWYTLVLVPLPLLAIIMFGLYYVRNDPLAGRMAAKSA